MTEKKKTQYIRKGTNITANKGKEFLVKKNIQNKWLVSFSVLLSLSEWLKVSYNSRSAEVVKMLKQYKAAFTLSKYEILKSTSSAGQTEPKSGTCKSSKPPSKEKMIYRAHKWIFAALVLCFTEICMHVNEIKWNKAIWISLFSLWVICFSTFSWSWHKA